MKNSALLLCSSAILLSACSNDAPISQKAKQSAETETAENIFIMSAFEDRNSGFLSAGGQSYTDADASGYTVLDAGIYTAEAAAALRVCARMNAIGANPAIRVRGNDGKLLLTAILTSEGADASLKTGKGAGEVDLVDGKMCLNTEPMPEGAELTVSVYPAISTTGGRYDKSAMGDLRITDIAVEWITK